MPTIVAYMERERVDPQTGDPGILRDEWRVRKVSDFKHGELEQQFGSGWRGSRPFAEYVLEHRYIRRGVEEPWIPFDAANTRKQALEYIEDSAIAIDPTLKRLQEEREGYRREQAAEEEQKRIAELEAEEQRRREERTQEVFRKLLASEKNRVWAERWNAYVESKRGDRDFLETAQQNETFMRMYREVLDAQTVPAKVKAIKLFLQTYGEIR